MKFVLVRCPEGIIGTVADGIDITVDRDPMEVRGYALVEESLAKNLTSRNQRPNVSGYEIVPFNEYPRNINRLPKHVRDREGLRHATLNMDGTISYPSTSSAKVQVVNVSASLAPAPCIFCRIANRFFRPRKVSQTGQG